MPARPAPAASASSAPSQESVPSGMPVMSQALMPTGASEAAPFPAVAASRPAASSVPPEAFAAAVSLTAPLRPTWLLDPPEPLASDAYGRPLHGGPLQLCSRAERIEAGWFDGGLARRDYHVALGSDHRLRWIYRERSAGAAAHEAGWFLHGWFG